MWYPGFDVQNHIRIIYTCYNTSQKFPSALLTFWIILYCEISKGKTGRSLERTISEIYLEKLKRWQKQDRQFRNGRQVMEQLSFLVQFFKMWFLVLSLQKPLVNYRKIAALSTWVCHLPTTFLTIKFFFLSVPLNRMTFKYWWNKILMVSKMTQQYIKIKDKL